MKIKVIITLIVGLFLMSCGGDNSEVETSKDYMNSEKWTSNEIDYCLGDCVYSEIYCNCLCDLVSGEFSYNEFLNIESIIAANKSFDSYTNTELDLYYRFMDIAEKNEIECVGFR